MSDEPEGKSLVGRKNGYTCCGCGWRIVTVDRDAGVTPFMIGCENTEPTEEDHAKARECEFRGRGSAGCGAMMESAFYRVPHTLIASHEWYAPSKKQKRKLGEAMREHVDKGGLMLRRINDADKIAAFMKSKAEAKSDA